MTLRKMSTALYILVASIAVSADSGCSTSTVANPTMVTTQAYSSPRLPPEKEAILRDGQAGIFVAEVDEIPPREASPFSGLSWIEYSLLPGVHTLSVRYYCRDQFLGAIESLRVNR